MCLIFHSKTLSNTFTRKYKTRKKALKMEKQVVMKESEDNAEIEMEGVEEKSPSKDDQKEKIVVHQLYDEIDSSKIDGDESEVEIPDQSVYKKHLETQKSIVTKIWKEEKQHQIKVEKSDEGEMILCTDFASKEGEDKIELKPLDDLKPISERSLSELGILTEPPFEGAVEGRDYVELVDEVDATGNPTGKMIIPGDCEHVRSKLDPYYGQNMNENEKAQEREKYKQYMLSKYGVEDPETGEYRLANLDDKRDHQLLSQQRGWTIRKKVLSGESEVSLSGGFGTSPEEQGFLRSATVPVDMLMFKLISYNNTLKYESQLISEISIDAIVKTPPYLAILSNTKYPFVANSHAIKRYLKIFEDLFIDKWPIDKDCDYTMAGTGLCFQESIPDLSMLSLEEREMKVLGIRTDNPKEMIKASPQKNPRSTASGIFSYDEKDPDDIEEIFEQNDLDEKEQHKNEKSESKKLKRKLKNFWTRDDLIQIDPMDWCPHFGSKDSSEKYSEMMAKWFDLVIQCTDKEIEARMEEQNEERIKYMKENLGDLYSQGADKQEEHRQDEEDKEQQSKEDKEEKMNDDEERPQYEDFYADKSPGEPITDWFCTFSGPENLDKTAVSAFFRRFVREGWLIKLMKRDIILQKTRRGGYLVGQCLYEIVEHWKSQCTMDIATRGGHQKLFPGNDVDQLKDFSKFVIETFKRNWGDTESQGFSYLNNVADFLGQVATDYVLRKLWKNPEEVVKFEYPKRSDIFKLLMSAENAVSQIELEEIPIPTCDDCESFHHEWSYHWKNRQLVNLENYVMNEISARVDDSINMYKKEMTCLIKAKISKADIQECSTILPPDPLRNSMNGNFLLDIEKPVLEGDRLFQYPKLLHEIFISLHSHLVLQISVLSLYIQLITARWVPLSVRQKFGYVPDDDPYKNMIKREDITDLSMKRHVFMRRANMETKLKSVGLEATSSIYETLILRSDHTYPDIDLDQEAEKCLFGDVSYPELDLMTDMLRYINLVSSKEKRPSDKDFYEMIKHAISTKAKFMIPDDVDVGSQFTSEEMMRMIEVTEKFKDPIAREEAISGDKKKQGKRMQNKKNRRRQSRNNVKKRSNKRKGK